jgi:hypothetical protein
LPYRLLGEARYLLGKFQSYLGSILPQAALLRVVLERRVFQSHLGSILPPPPPKPPQFT